MVKRTTTKAVEKPQLNRLLTADAGHTRRKSWEIHMALTTLREYGAIHRDAEILGVGAGREDTIFILSNEVRRVVATDIYLDPGAWGSTHGDGRGLLMGKYPDIPCDRQRIVFQHVDARDLPFPDNSFDGVFSSGSIEHFGTFADIAQAAREIGRVLRPGGVASISTEFRVGGREGNGFPGVVLFNVDTLREHIIEPSGLTLIDEPTWDKPLDEESLATAWSLATIVNEGRIPPQEVVLEHDGYLFTSVHLALRKIVYGKSS